jgi:hypothetical protein
LISVSVVVIAAAAIALLAVAVVRRRFCFAPQSRGGGKTFFGFGTRCLS